MAEVLSTLSLISFITAGLCFVLAILFFIKFGIPTVIGDLSGHTARKSIKKMRENNENSGHKSYKPSTNNVLRGKITGSIPDLKEINRSTDEHPETDLLKSNKSEFNENYETTGLLNNSKKAVQTENMVTTEKVKDNVIQLKIIDDVLLIHTDEVI